jgi:hypothetical protein
VYRKYRSALPSKIRAAGNRDMNDGTKERRQQEKVPSRTLLLEVDGGNEIIELCAFSCTVSRVDGFSQS